MHSVGGGLGGEANPRHADRACKLCKLRVCGLRLRLFALYSDTTAGYYHVYATGTGTGGERGRERGAAQIEERNLVRGKPR